MIFGFAARAQVPGTAERNPHTIELAFTYSPELTQLAPGKCGCLWLQGGSLDASEDYGRGFAHVFSVSGEHAGNIVPDVNFNKVEFLAGERYTHGAGGRGAFALREQKRSVFSEGLLGGVHAFNGLFPAKKGFTPSASGFAMRVGGGFELAVSRRIRLRIVQADYVLTTLPNNASNSQHDLRVAAGFIFRLDGD
jgi:peptidoglycan-associated lipoprotein